MEGSPRGVRSDEDLFVRHADLELAHLAEFNHSTKFWARVAAMMPEYKEVKKELRGKWRL